MHNAGRLDKANRVTLAANHHYRDAPETPFLTKVWLSAKWLFLCYGYRIYYIVPWFLLLLAMGALAASMRPRDPQLDRLRARFLYSFDQTIPFLSPGDEHSQIELTGRVRVYFYLHQILGFILITLIIAGLTGLAPG